MIFEPTKKMSGMFAYRLCAGLLVAPFVLSSLLLACDPSTRADADADGDSESVVSPELEQNVLPTSVPARIRSVRASGLLCSKFTPFVADGGDALTVVFEDSVESQTGAFISKKCTVSLDIELPRGQQFNGARIAWQGFALGAGMRATVQGSVSFAATTPSTAPRIIYAKSLKAGDLRGTWVAPETVEIWSPCATSNGTVTLNAEVTASLQSEGAGSGAYGLVTVDAFNVSFLSSTSSIGLRACAPSR